MMLRVAAFVIGALAALPLHAADDRTLLNHCKALVASAAQAQKNQTTVANDAEIQHCRQIISEWTLRDSRMLVDENGRPLPLQ